MASRTNIAYQQLKVGEIAKSGFDLSHKSKISGKVARLIPSVLSHICVPSDRYKCSNKAAFQFEPLAVPLVSDMKMSLHNFFVPFRIIDKNFEKVMEGDTKDPSDELIPSNSLLSLFNRVYGRIFTYANLPTQILDFAGKGNPSFGSFDWTKFFNGVSFYSVVSPYLQFLKLDDTYQPWFSQLQRFANSIPRQSQDYTVDVDIFVGFDVSGEDVRILSFGYYEILINRIKTCLYDVIDFLFGEGSLLDFLQYPIITHDVIDSYVSRIPVYRGTPSSLRSINAIDDETKSALDSVDAFAEYIVVANSGNESLGRFALGDLFANETAVKSEYPLRAYYRIWFDYYRDINLEKDVLDPATFDATNIDPCILLPLRIRAWGKDLFTTAMIDDPSYHVLAPVTSEATISYRSGSGANMSQLPDDTVESIELKYHDYLGVERTVTTPTVSRLRGYLNGTLNDETAYRLDLALLKRCQHLQDFLRRDFFFGPLYRDQIEAHFGIKSKDSRLQYSEFISGSDTYVSLSTQVNNTTTSEMDAGEKTAVAYGSPDGDGFSYFCDEHGILINILSLLPEAQYNPSPKQLSCLKRIDFGWPEFANEGAEIMLASELTRNHVAHLPFGYQPRYYEYRTAVDRVHGQMLSSKRGYTFLRDWDAAPVLNHAFIHCHPNLSMFYTDDELYDLFFGDFRHDIYAERPFPRFVDMF